MSNFKHELVAADDVELHVVSAGSQKDSPLPPVIFCHGMPGLWYSWRHQLEALAEAGLFAVAFDQRGYGRSSRPPNTADYSNHHTVNDLRCLLRHLQVERAIFIGQDFGAAQVYNMAVRHPQQVAAVVGMACPFDFDFSGRGGAWLQPNAEIQRPFARPDRLPSECFAAIAEQQFFYAHYYQQIGPAEAELAANPYTFLRRLFWALSGSGKLLEWSNYPATVNGYIDVLAEPEQALPWLWFSAVDLQYYVSEFMQAQPGLEFIGGLSAYRAADLNWTINADYIGQKIAPPSLFIAGAEDPVITMIDPTAFGVLEQSSDDLRGIHLVAGAGHFVQQEAAAQCNQHIIDFCRSLG